MRRAVYLRMLKLVMGALALHAALALLWSEPARADENFFGYVKGAETLPKGTYELYETLTYRGDKGEGTYRAYDSDTELEYGITNRLTGSVSLKAQSVETKGLLIDAYIPKDHAAGLDLSGIEAAVKYNFLSPAKDDIGLAGYFAIDYGWLDPHSGQDKTTVSFDTMMLAQKYFLDDQLVWVGNLGLESTIADRDPIANLPAGFEWPTDPEMEIEFTAGTGVNYRFAPRWFAGGEIYYQQERETGVDIERWSVQAGPNLHYGSSNWWATLTWLPQLRGGGLEYAGQQDTNLHLIEKTKQEVRLKMGYNF